MKIRIFTFAVLVALSYESCHLAYASDHPLMPGYFLPGDAFFYTVITEKELKELDKNPNYAFEYNRSSRTPHNSGYYSLSLGKHNQKLAKQIKKAYYEIRNSSQALILEVSGKSPNSVEENPPKKKTEFVELNGLSLLFYNENYNWQKRHIALKYNENWQQELLMFGFPKGDYSAFINTTDAIIESWRFSTQVRPLMVQLPSVPIKKQEAIMKAPIVPTGRIKAIMLVNNEFEKYYTNEDLQELIEITNDKMSFYHCNEGKWDHYGQE